MMGVLVASRRQFNTASHDEKYARLPWPFNVAMLIFGERIREPC